MRRSEYRIKDDRPFAVFTRHKDEKSTAEPEVRDYPTAEEAITYAFNAAQDGEHWDVTVIYMMTNTVIAHLWLCYMAGKEGEVILTPYATRKMRIQVKKDGGVDSADAEAKAEA